MFTLLSINTSQKPALAAPLRTRLMVPVGIVNSAQQRVALVPIVVDHSTLDYEKLLPIVKLDTRLPQFEFLGYGLVDAAAV